MTSQQAKIGLLNYYIYRRNAALATTEYTVIGGIADVFVVDQSLQSIEIEIKCSKQDLMGEIKSIQAAMMKDTLLATTDKGSKFWKHDKYLNKMLLGGASIGLKPNKFYFAVPESLVSFATKAVENIPYGVIEMKFGSQPIVRVRAKNLHANKFDGAAKLLRKLSMENLVLRSNNHQLNLNLQTNIKTKNESI